MFLCECEHFLWEIYFYLSKISSSLFEWIYFSEFHRSKVHRTDFMSMSGVYFTWIASFCTLCRMVVYNLKNSFQNELFVNANLLSESLFIKQTDDIIQSFIDRSINEPTEITASLRPLSAAYSSFDSRMNSNGSIRIDPDDFDNCSCLLHIPTYSTAAGFYSFNPSNNSFTLLSTVKGVRVHCLPSLSFLQLTSRWLHIGVIEFMTIFENLMIEQWSNNASYSAFFDHCNPLYCIYSNNERPSVIFIIAILVGIFGGLNVVLKLLIPLILRVFFWFWTNTQGI